MTETITLPREVAKRILRNIEIGNKLSAGIEMRREIEAALEQPQVEQEPVAWAEEIIEYLHAHYDTEMIKELDSGDALIRLDDAIAAVEEVAQRHARPQPRQPLTNEQVKAGLIDSIDFADQRERCAFNLGVRFAERAHGIGGEK